MAMDSFRQTNRKILLLWSLFLSLALLCAQSINLHVHDLDHTHGADELSGHTHLSKAHFAHDISHDHHYGEVSELDVSPDGVVKNLNHSAFAIALFVIFFSLIAFVSSRHVHQRRRKDKLIHHDYLLSPPLRAPPQY